jgi:hypothetical protein
MYHVATSPAKKISRAIIGSSSITHPQFMKITINSMTASIRAENVTINTIISHLRLLHRITAITSSASATACTNAGVI